MTALRFTPLTLISGLTLKNRLVVPPMASQTANSDGLATDKTFSHYQNLAQSGAGLVMVEYSHINLAGRSETNQLGAHDDACLPGLTHIAKLLHQMDVKTGLQITHCGGKDSAGISADIMGPSGITVPAYDRVLPTPRAMTLDDIATWQQDFVNGAIRANKAGFDLVELHCAHGYGINQWLSPLTNQRQDQYGGSLENRARILLEIVSKIKQAAPRLAVMTRIPGQDGYPGGLSHDDMGHVSRWLVDAGVEILNVSSGIGGWNRPKDKRGEGFLVEDAAPLTGKTAAAVIGVGGIESIDYIETILATKQVDLVAVGRAILAGPGDFATRVMAQHK
ncbi:NADH:flavin oxidoreductase [Shewanella frigidimarina]|uniref:NADH:flavin oxidoreductase n=1 Tax=Shewanella frigidimarina TaxID=56812 RepID=A0A125BE08_SHEFR|nr:NADH:flavin oxidoreductase [Shewanella frigidimarina]KVX00340.1 NADH:flavin oxidoreductase [Shewanella frigidimarina]